jgi:pilus assembly protein CpaE
VPAFVVHADSNDQRAGLLVKLLGQYGYEVLKAQTLKDVRGHARFGAEKTFVLVPEAPGDPARADDIVRFAEAENARAFVIYIADTMSADGYKRLVRSNAGEWITWEALTRELADVLHRAERTGSELQGQSATIVSFLPSKGGVGNTTLAVETGIHLASGKKRSNTGVAVVDLNFQSSTLADYLDLDPRFDILEIMDRPERLDAQLVDIFASKHSANVDIFSSPPRLISSQSIRPEVIFALLDEIGKRYSYVLLDLPNQWHSWLDNVLQGSSAIVLTGEGTVPSIRQMISKQKHLDELGIERDRAAIVVNACDTNLLGRVDRKAEIEKTFTGRRIFYVPRDRNSASEAANTGRPMMLAASSRAITKNIRRIGDWIHSIRLPAGAAS